MAKPTDLAAGASRPAATQAWWGKPFGLFQTNIAEVDGDLDVEATAGEIDRLGYNVWQLNAGGICYFYPTAHPDFQRPAASLSGRPGGDLIGDALAAARRHGIGLVARFDFSRLAADLMASHRDWAHLGADGRPVEDDGLVNICPNSDYHAEVVPAILADFVARYPVDGVFFNWLNWAEATYRGKYAGPCHCDRCRDGFAAASDGAPHPTGPRDPAYPAWVAYSRAVIQRLAERYRAIVQATLPGAAVFLADAKLDIGFLEVNSPVGRSGAPADWWWTHTPSELASVYQNLADAPPGAVVHAAANLGFAYRAVDEEPDQYRRYIAQGLVRGANPGSVIVGKPLIGRNPSVEAAADLVRFHRDNASLYAELRPGAPVGLIRPASGLAMAAMQARPDFSGYRGVFAALQERHIPFDVFAADDLARAAEASSLDRLSVLVAPDGAGLARADLDAIGQWTAGGGRTLAIGEFRADHQAGPEFLPVPMDGDRLTGSELDCRYVGGEEGVRWPAIGHYYRMGAGAGQARRWLTTPAPPGPPERVHGWSALEDWPDRARGRHGQGLVTQLAWSAGRSAHLSGLSSLADAIAAEVLDLLGDGLEVRADFPRTVELTLGQVADGYLVQLLNHSGGRLDRARRPTPASGRLVLTGRLASARAVRSLTANQALPVRLSPAGLEVAVGRLNLLEVIHVAV
ncbi:MAG: hypothetical protein LBD70_07180 [Bifidobacteriaceae bacterium]|jgi:hypothetical protein|nr:hypothetical protein [Bifidobacteriaceae bacterium]